MRVGFQSGRWTTVAYVKDFSTGSHSRSGRGADELRSVYLFREIAKRNANQGCFQDFMRARIVVSRSDLGRMLNEEVEPQSFLGIETDEVDTIISKSKKILLWRFFVSCVGNVDVGYKYRKRPVKILCKYEMIKSISCVIA